MERKPESEFFINLDNREQWMQFYGLEYLFRFPRDIGRLDTVVAHALRHTLITFLYYLSNRDSIREHHDKWEDVARLMEMAARMIRGRYAGLPAHPLTTAPPDTDDSDLGDMLDGIEGL